MEEAHILERRLGEPQSYAAYKAGEASDCHLASALAAADDTCFAVAPCCHTYQHWESCRPWHHSSYLEALHAKAAAIDGRPDDVAIERDVAYVAVEATESSAVREMDDD